MYKSVLITYKLNEQNLYIQLNIDNLYYNKLICRT